MKKILLFTLALVSYLNSYSQISYCTPYYTNGCYFMGINSVTIDSVNGTNKFNSSNLSINCAASGGYSDFTYSAVDVSKPLQAGGNYSITINSSTNIYNQYFAFLIDLNSDGDFTDSGESFFPNTIGYSNTILFQIPSGTSIGRKRIRVMSSYYSIDNTSICSSSLTWGESEDFNIKVGNLPMTFVSSTTNAIPNSTIVLPNDTSKYVLQVQVNMDGNSPTQTLKNLKFTTSGTNRISAIKNAKLWYSGNSYNLNYGNQKIGTTILSPKDTFNFALTQPLMEGTNVFWLTYDVDSKSVPNDTLKATCEEITIETSKYTPSLKNGAAGGLIVDYCNNKFKNGYQLNIKSISVGNIIESNYSGNIDNYYSPDQYNFLYIYQGGNTGYSIINNSQKMYYGIYIDFNKDGLYSGTGEFIDLGLQQPDSKMTGTINAPINAILGINRTRIICSDTPLDLNSFCLNGDNGEVHDYTTYIQTPTIMEVKDALYYFEYDKKISIPSTNNEIIRVDIQTTGSTNPIKIKKISFNTGNTNPKNIVNAKLWYNGILSDFSTAVQIGNVIPSPNGILNFDFDVQLLDNGSNFFWLSYDVPKGAPINENLDATPLNIVDQTGRIKDISPDTKSTYYPNNILGKRVTAGTTTMKDTTIVGCSYKFYDDGGATGDYSNNAYKITFVAPDTMNRMSITFNTLDLAYDGEAYDAINIYDGQNSIESISYLEGNQTFTTTNTDSLTIVFDPQHGINAGWDANISCAYRCDIDPLIVDYKLTPQCINEKQIYNQTITSGLNAPYTYTINRNYTRTFFISNSINYDTLLESGSYSINVTNNKGCNAYLYPYVPYSYTSFTIYTDKTYPTCNKAQDGSIYINAYAPETNLTIDSIIWFGKNRKGLGYDIDSVGYNQVYTYKLYYNNTCEYDTLNSPYNSEIDLNNDTTDALVLNEIPVITDSLFTTCEIKHSAISIKPLNQFYYNNQEGRVISPYINTILPDSIHWVSTPVNAVNIAPGDTIATAIWNSNFSGIATIKAEPLKGVCRGYFSPETKVTIKPYAKLSSNDSVSIYKNDSAKISLSLAGTKPFTLTYRKPSSKLIDTLKNIDTNSFTFYVKNEGTYQLINVLDSSLTVQNLDTTITIKINRVSSATAVINQLKCHNGKTDIGFIIKGGKAPYQIHLADSKLNKFTFKTKKSANDSTGIDTSLVAGNYVYRIVDAAKDTSTIFELNIIDSLKAVTIPAIISQISNVPVNTAKLNIAVSSAVAKTSYLWLSSDTTLIKTKSTASSATFNITSAKTGVADLSVIAIDGNGCKSDTSGTVQLTIYPTVTLAPGGNTIFYNESDSLKISFNGSLPASLSISGFSKNDSIFTLSKSSISIPIYKSGTYKLTSATDLNGISAPANTNEYILKVDTISNIKLSTTGAACAGKKGTISVTATGGKAPYTYYYFLTAKSKGSIKADTNLVAGTYFVSVKDAAGYEIANPLKVIISNSSQSLPGSNITSPISPQLISIDTASTTFISKSNNNAISYTKWIIFPSKAGDIIDSNNTTTINWNPNFSGYVKVLNVGITNEGCITDSSNAINIIRKGKLENLTIDNPKIFTGDSATVSIEISGTAPFDLTYTIGNTNYTIKGITSSPYKFKVGVTGILSVNKGIDSYGLTMENLINNTLTISKDTISTLNLLSIKDAACSVTLGDIKVDILGGKAPYTLVAQDSLLNKNTFIVNSIDTISLKVGKYSFKITDSTGTSSNIIKSHYVIVDTKSIENFKTSINPNQTTITNEANASTSLSTNMNLSNITYHWNVTPANAGNFTSTSNVNSINWNKNFSGNAIISLVANDGTCQTNTATTTIKVKANVVVSLSNNTAIDVKVYGRGPFNVTVGQNTATSNFVTQDDTLVEFGNSKEITFIQVIDLSTGDTTMINKTIVKPNLEITIYDGFSPNKDGKNDVFEIDNLDNTVKSQLIIVDELGNSIFKSKGDYYLNDWDGVDNNGKEIAAGIYICNFTYGGKRYSKMIEIRK